ncbi:antitoxin Xre/MbcA/ParS toxin-binding domain-containing protein [Xanthobacter sp. 126]|uniref:antitoxin Xre/MbcA/ParS toxin-binding domain-containing protein n=1 Tax=Xanthobacter sp. 126 TaxID=1131814 RepID=UPI00045E8342|nr:antitoxin Xre/MbcA/ParS toxin-binding domain-containing protein [Xanthobacter sp. 126]
MRAAPLADAPLSQGAVLTKALLRAADRLGVTGATLAAVIGLSPASLTRMKKGEFALETGTKPFELAILFVRLFRSLDAIAGGDERIARAWLANPNTALGDAPIEKIRTIPGLMDVIAYLDARRAVV